MPKPEYTSLIAELSNEDRQLIEERARFLSVGLRACQIRLQQYGAGEETSMKLLGEMDSLRWILEEARSELVKGHKLPSDWNKRKTT